jgi:predicted DCC family thiol-disulfide oxidoreductase YuxK
VPAPLRDALYRIIARNRYRLFGSSESCLIPPRGQAARFLD